MTRTVRSRLLYLIAAGLLVGCGSVNDHSPAREGAGAATAPVSVTIMEAVAAPQTLAEVPGTVEPARVASLSSRLAATIQNVAVEEGARVRKGDLLVRLDGRDLAAQVEAAEARLVAARAHRERIESLLEKEAATRQEMESAHADAGAAEAAVKAARAQLEYIEIRAPFDGRVVARGMQTGDLASPGREILSVQGEGLMRVAASVSEQQAARLSTGQTLEGILEGGGPVPCAISVLNPAGDPSSRRFLLKCDLPEGTTARSGSFARLRVPGDPGDSLVVVSRQAIIERGGLTGLFVVESGVARLRWISPGSSLGDELLVRAGLMPGEDVILSPGALSDGTPVAATAPHEPTP